eukprot:jgi/Botrbrau1/21468/Bobra.0216s0076.1
MEGTKVDRADLFMRKMKDKITLARKCLRAAQDRQVAYASRHKRAASFQEGDYVLLSTRAAPTLTSNRLSKLQPRHVGPFQVMEATPDNTNFVTLDLPDRLDIHPRIPCATGSLIGHVKKRSRVGTAHPGSSPRQISPLTWRGLLTHLSTIVFCTTRTVSPTIMRMVHHTLSIR